MDKKDSLVALELVKMLGDFYFNVTRAYVTSSPGKCYLKLPTSQINRIRQEFEKSTNNEQRKQNIKDYLKRQAENTTNLEAKNIGWSLLAMIAW